MVACHFLVRYVSYVMPSSTHHLGTPLALYLFSGYVLYTPYWVAGGGGGGGGGYQEETNKQTPMPPNLLQVCRHSTFYMSVYACQNTGVKTEMGDGGGGGGGGGGLRELQGQQQKQKTMQPNLAHTCTQTWYI